MCMYCVINDGKKINHAWKVLEYDKNKKEWFTPFQYEIVRNNILVAKGEISPGASGRGIGKGVIHCYRTKKAAKKSWIMQKDYSPYLVDVFKVVGKDLVGYNDKEVAFKEVEFVDNVDDWEI